MKCPKLFTIHLYIILMHYVLNCVLVYEFYKVNLSFNKSDLNIPHFISLVICCKALPTLILNMLSLLDSPTFLLAEQNDGQWQRQTEFNVGVPALHPTVWCLWPVAAQSVPPKHRWDHTTVLHINILPHTLLFKSFG